MELGHLDDVDGCRVFFKGTRKIERRTEVVFSLNLHQHQVEPERHDIDEVDSSTPNCAGAEIEPDE